MEAIDRYLDNEMGDEERADFERLVANDPALASELALQQRITAALQDNETWAFQERLAKIREERKTAQVKAPPKNKRLVKWGALAAFSVLLIWACYRFFFKNMSPAPAQPSPIDNKGHTPPTDTSAVAKDVEPPADPAVVPLSERLSTAEKKVLADKQYQEYLAYAVGTGDYMGDGTARVDKDSLALAFEQKDYVRVLALAQKFSPDDAQINTVNWTAAHAAFLMDDCTKAIFYANKIVKINSKTRQEEAELLLLLTYLKCGRTQTPLFKSLIEKCRKDKFHPGYALAQKLY